MGYSNREFSLIWYLWWSLPGSDESSPNLCVKFFRQCYVAGDVLASLVYPEARLEETVKGAEHLVRGSLDSFRLACY